MALIYHGTEVDKVIYHGTEVDYVIYHGTEVFASTVFVAKPTISGSFTFDNTTKTPTITGYNASAMVQTGTTSATAAGTYTVTFHLNNGYAWNDNTTADVVLTWSIAKRTITIPSLTGTTAFAFVQGATHSVSDTGFNSTYATRSGTWSATDGSSYSSTITNTVSWALKYPASTTWADSTTADKTATWTVGWVNGTSHYSNDLYNQGWDSGLLGMQNTVNTGEYLSVTNNGAATAIYTLNATDGTFHALVACAATVHLGNVNANDTGHAGIIASVEAPARWTEISGAHTNTRPRFGLYAGNDFQVQRIWLT